MKQAIEFEFTLKRCEHCGTFWQIESSRDNGAHKCGRCSLKVTEDLCEEIRGLERRITALKGVIKRKSKGN